MYRCIILSIITLCFANQSIGQSLAFSVPNASTTHKHHLEFTHESQIGFAGTYNSFNILTYGLTKRTELTLNAINVSDGFPKGVSYGAGFKSVLPLASLPLPELSLTLGTNIKYGPAMGYKRPVGFFSYTHLSAKLPRWGTRLSAGGAYGTPHAFGFSRRATPEGDQLIEGNYPLTLMAIVEQPLSKELLLIADFFSGTHAQAALIAGLQYKIGALTSLLGYKRSNSSRAKDALIAELVFDVPLQKTHSEPEPTR